MLGRGLEPPRVAPPAPKAGASTNFATPAYSACYIIIPCRHKSHLPVARCARDPGSLSRKCGTYLRLGQKQKTCRRAGFLVLCPPTRIRTSDHLLKRELLYQLSYGRLQLCCANFARPFAGQMVWGYTFLPYFKKTFRSQTGTASADKKHIASQSAT